MNLNRAVLCLDCEEVLDRTQLHNQCCPLCSSPYLSHISRWLLPLMGERQYAAYQRIMAACNLVAEEG